MATAVAVGDVLQLRVWTSDTEQAAVNTYYYEVNSIDSGAPTDQDFATAMDSALDSWYKALLANTATYDGVQALIFRESIIPPPPFFPFATVFANAFAGAGTAGAIALPRQTACLISWKTDFRGPSNRGRTYLPFPAAADDEGNGNPTANYLGRVTDLADVLRATTAFTNAGRTAGVHQVLRRNAPPEQWWDISGYTVRDAWATQRRRGSYGKANLSPV